MKKIEEAARKFYAEICFPQYDPRDPFIAGARCVLDKLTSDEVLKAVVKRVIADSGGFGEDQTATAVNAVGRAIDAVRKEIEG